MAAVERMLAGAPGTAHPSALVQASFLTRLARALLVEPDFPALPEAFERLLERDRARRAARQLAECHQRESRSFTNKGANSSAPDRKSGVPSREIDHRLAAQTAVILRDLEARRLSWFAEYLEMCSTGASATGNPEVAAASLALVDRYWRARRQLPRIDPERPQAPTPRPKRHHIEA